MSKATPSLLAASLFIISNQSYAYEDNSLYLGLNLGQVRLETTSQGTKSEPLSSIGVNVGYQHTPVIAYEITVSTLLKADIKNNGVKTDEEGPGNFISTNIKLRRQLNKIQTPAHVHLLLGTTYSTIEFTDLQSGPASNQAETTDGTLYGYNYGIGFNVELGQNWSIDIQGQAGKGKLKFKGSSKINQNWAHYSVGLSRAF